MYGADDRLDYFETDSEAARATLASAAVALIPRSNVGAQGGLSQATPSFGASNQLCAGERFSEQPAAAFCSGVLVDWDLVLTAGHCVQPFAISDFVVVLGYYLEAPGQLALREGGLLDVAEVVAVERGGVGASPRVDYAWLRLAHAVSAPNAPVPVLVDSTQVSVDQAVTVISAVGGTPLKADAGGRVRDPRSEWDDYLVADTDTNHGSSGAGLFNERFELVGVLARGGTDFAITAEGCYTSSVVSDASAAEEEFTYAGRALAGLCAQEPKRSLCRAGCAGVCQAEARRVVVASGGCAFTRGAQRAPSWLVLTFATVLAARVRRRQVSQRRR
ncbi:MAG: serine protease [Polyangiaceae bacterium]